MRNSPEEYHILIILYPFAFLFLSKQNMYKTDVVSNMCFDENWHLKITDVDIKLSGM